MTALSGYRILELAESVSGEYCGKLLADFGAEVIKIEVPGVGSPTRHLGPFAAGGKTSENSGLFAYLNTNKRSVELDLTSDAGRTTLQQLVEAVDVVVDDHAPGWLASMGLDPEQFETKWPGLVLCSITPYGQNPPDERKHAEERAGREMLMEKQFAERLQLLQEQLRTTTEKLLKQRADELDKSNRSQMDSIIAPLKAVMTEMKKSMDDNRESFTRSTASLGQQSTLSPADFW